MEKELEAETGDHQPLNSIYTNTFALINGSTMERKIRRRREKEIGADGRNNGEAVDGSWVTINR